MNGTRRKRHGCAALLCHLCPSPEDDCAIANILTIELFALVNFVGIIGGEQTHLSAVDAAIFILPI